VDKIKAGQPLKLTDPAMTRFLMSLEESVDLVLHAFTHGQQGDIFVQKAPACTVEVLAAAIKRIFRSDAPIQVIGSRHGEKLHETLVSREELSNAEDMGRYFRVPADNRDLNYEQYTETGNPRADELSDYTSGNTERLNVDQVVETLMQLDYIRAQLAS
jgi:UDP-glucose 4-epimerase